MKTNPFVVAFLIGLPISASFAMSQETGAGAFNLDETRFTADNGPRNWTLTILEPLGDGLTVPESGSHLYQTGQSAQVQAHAAPGWRLSHWLLNGRNLGHLDPIAIASGEADEEKTLQAVFYQGPYLDLWPNRTIHYSGGRFKEYSLCVGATREGLQRVQIITPWGDEVDSADFLGEAWDGEEAEYRMDRFWISAGIQRGQHSIVMDWFELSEAEWDAVDEETIAITATYSDGEWSGAVDFSDAPLPDQTPNITYPADRQTGVETEPAFEWDEWRNPGPLARIDVWLFPHEEKGMLFQLGLEPSSVSLPSPVVLAPGAWYGIAVEFWNAFVVLDDGNVHLVSRSNVKSESEFATETDEVDNPHFNVDPGPNSIWGHEWPAGETVTVLVGDPGEVVAVKQVNAWGDWSAWDTDYDIRPGDLVRVQCGAIEKTHRITNIRITDVDTIANIITGTADPYSSVIVGVFDIEDEVGRYIQVDAEGNWAADFGTAAHEGEGWDRAFDIEPGHGGSASQQDGDGDTTFIVWRAEVPRPMIASFPASHDFGYLDHGFTVTQSFEIVNLGKLDLHIHGVVLADGDDLEHFEMIEQTVAGVTLAPHGAETGRVTVVFAPLSPWDKAVALRIDSSDPENPEFMIPLYGAGRPEGQAHEYFEAALDALAAYMRGEGGTSGLTDAAAHLATALLADADHYGAILYRILTRFLTLPYTGEIARLLDDLGMPAEGRDLRDWTALFADPLPADAPALGRITETLFAELDIAIAEGLADLARFPADWSGSVVLRPRELPIDNEAQVDAADIEIFRSILAFTRGILTMLRAHDWNFDPRHLDSLDTPRLDITVDGDPSDWADARPLHIDARGNHYGPDSTDLHRVFTAMDDTHAYIMIDTHVQPIHATAPISVILNFKPGRHMWLDETPEGHDPGRDDLGIRFGAGGIIDAWDSAAVTLEGVAVARGAVFEAAIPLAELGNPDYVAVTYMNIWPEGFEGLPGNPVSIAPRIGDYLEDYPEFGIITNAAAFIRARDMFAEAVDFYLAGSELIRAETDWQGDDLFTFDPDSLDVERGLRKALVQIRDAMTGAAKGEPFSFEISRFLDLEDLFENPFSPRDLQTGGGIQDTIFGMIRHQIDFALENLAAVDADYSETLTPENAPVSEMLNLDYGDIAMVEVWLNFWKAVTLALQSYDIDADIVAELENPLEENRVGAFLDAHEQFLTVTRPENLAAASEALAAALDGYAAASDILRAREGTGEMPFFEIANGHLLLAGGVLSEHENRLRDLMRGLRESLHAPRPIFYRHEDGVEPFNAWLHIGRFFAEPYVTRAHLPQFDAANTLVPGSLPDTTFNGILPDMTGARAPATPRSPRATEIAFTEIGLEWDAAGQAEGYRLQRRIPPRGEWETIAETDDATLQWRDFDVAAGSRHAYRVGAFNWVGDSGFSAPLTIIVPSPPETGAYGLHTANASVTIGGVSVTDGAVTLCGAEIDFRLDALLSNPDGVAAQHRVAVGLRETGGAAVGSPLEIAELIRIPDQPPAWIADVSAPRGLRVPAKPGIYRLWIESHVGPGCPLAAFIGNTHATETVLARRLVEIEAVAPIVSDAAVMLGRTSGCPGDSVVLPVSVNALGGENALGFSLKWDAGALAFDGIEPLDPMAGAHLVVNPVAEGAGAAMLLPAQATLEPGVHEIAAVRFLIDDQAPAGTEVAVMFSDLPAALSVADAGGEPMPHVWTDGAIEIVRGLEADVSPRSRPDGRVTEQDVVRIMRFAAGLDIPRPGREFQAADCAPIETRGNGVIDIRDAVVAGRYVAGLLEPRDLGGPREPIDEGSVQAAGVVETGRRMQSAVTLIMGRDGDTVSRGDILEAPVTLDSGGQVAGLSFSVVFDPDKWTYLEAIPADGYPAAVALVNEEQAGSGRLGYTLRLNGGATLPSGSAPLLNAVFRAVATSDAGGTVIEFDEQPAPIFAADANGASIAILKQTATVNIVEPDTPGLPPDPAGFTAVAEGVSRLALFWEGATGATGYSLCRRIAGSSWERLAKLPEQARHYVDGGVGPGIEYHYRLKARNLTGESSGVVLTATLPSRYRLWAGDRIAPHMSAPYQDADGDGIVNYFEYLMGSDPLTPEQGLLRTALIDLYDLNDRYFTVAFRLREALPPSAVTVETSAEMEVPRWKPAPLVMNVTSNGYRWLRFRAATPESAATRQFLRVYPEKNADH